MVLLIAIVTYEKKYMGSGYAATVSEHFNLSLLLEIFSLILCDKENL